jgi:hypothetical protein
MVSDFRLTLQKEPFWYNLLHWESAVFRKILVVVVVVVVVEIEIGELVPNILEFIFCIFENNKF